MTLFDRYIAVDWSASNSPTTGKDSIWIGETARDSVNPPTRSAAMAIISERIAEARTANQRVLVGFDFVFGYPRGSAEAIAGSPTWQALWEFLRDHITDDGQNRSNRFAVAAQVNRSVGQRLYWGHPQQHQYDDLTPKRSALAYLEIPERRIAEGHLRRVQPVWKLFGAGSVGGQGLLGIPRLQDVRRKFGSEVAVWPFETNFAADLTAPIVVTEIYPSMFPVDSSTTPKDRAQVEATATAFCDLDREGKLSQWLSAPPTLSPDERELAVREEGWIIGVGHDELRRRVSPPSQQVTAARHETDPAAIYEKSFAIIRREADLSDLPFGLHPAAIRMIHACGMVDLAGDIVGTPDLPERVQAALAAGTPIYCDSRMVAAGLIGHKGIVTLPNVAPEGLTRSAAAVDRWNIAGSIIVIGNAPTALFRLLEKREKPAAVIGCPVGFVGAAESKALLEKSGLPFITVRGRRGGSAIAAAAFNALAGAGP